MFPPMAIDQGLNRLDADNISPITENELPTDVSNKPELLLHMSNHVELSSNMSNSVELPDVQNSAKLHDTNPVEISSNCWIYYYSFKWYWSKPSYRNYRTIACFI